MATLTVQTNTAVGTVANTPVQITAWPAGDTIPGSEVGERGIQAIVANASGGTLNFRISDPGRTPAGNAAANGYTDIAVATGTTMVVVITKNNIDPATGAVKVGASTSNAAFTVRLSRY